MEWLVENMFGRVCLQKVSISPDVSENYWEFCSTLFGSDGCAPNIERNLPRAAGHSSLRLNMADGGMYKLCLQNSMKVDHLWRRAWQQGGLRSLLRVCGPDCGTG